MEAASNQQLANRTPPFTQITSEKRLILESGKEPMAPNILKRNGAGDGTRTRDVQLGKITVV
jgi:hypothetical protein